MRMNFHLPLLFTFLCLVYTSADAESSVVNKSQTGKHPEITEQEKFLSCDECHQQATPDVYKQWFDSSHGIGMVKCYQCHGTYENFKVTPAISDCATCHVNMVEKCPKDKPCWACHTPHSFKRANK